MKIYLFFLSANNTSYEISSREPMWSQKNHIQKNSGIGVGVSLQLSFSSFEKIQNYDVKSGNHYEDFFGGNYDKLK